MLDLEDYPYFQWSSSKPHRPAFSWKLLLIASFLPTLTILYAGFKQFAGNDSGILSNAAWQMYIGYVPYRDFVSALPPFFLAGAKLAFEIFSPSWGSFVYFTALFSFISSFILGWLLFQIEISNDLTLLAVLAIQMATLTLPSFWWYNQTTSIISALFLCACMLFVQKPGEKKAEIILGISIGLLFLTKVNVALPLVGSALCVLCFSHRSIQFLRKPLFYSCIVIALVFLWLKIHPMELIKNYSYSAVRVTSWNSFFRILIMPHEDREFVWFIIKIIFFFLTWTLAERIYGLEFKIKNIRLKGLEIFNFKFIECKTSKKLSSFKPSHSPLLQFDEYLLVWCALLATGIGMITNNDMKISELPPLIVCLCVVSHRLSEKNDKKIKENEISFWPKKPEFFKLFLVFFLIAIIIYGFQLSISRKRVFEEGWKFFETDQLQTVRSPTYFKGLRTGREIQLTLRELDSAIDFIRSKGLQNYPIYFGAKIDFAYAAYGIQPITGLPLWWETFMNSSLKSDELVQRFEAAHPGVVILHNWYGSIFFPLKLNHFLEKQFQEIKLPSGRLKEIHILVRKDLRSLKNLQLVAVDKDSNK